VVAVSAGIVVILRLQNLRCVDEFAVNVPAFQVATPA
jgi:hypothetical protein